MNTKFDFEPKELEQILKVPNCTSLTELGMQKNQEEKGLFYFCSCKPNEYFPICEACAHTCHRSHNPVLKVLKKLRKTKCICGFKNHEDISEVEESENKQMCLFALFYSLTPNLGFFTLINEQRRVCSICAETCYEYVEKKPVVRGNENNSTCECDKHFEINILNMKSSFSKDITFYSRHLLNFNYNIFLANDHTREKMVNVVQNEIDNCIHNGSILQSNLKEGLFLNEFVAKIITLKKLAKTKYFSDTIKQDFLGNLSLNENTSGAMSKMYNIVQIIGTTFKYTLFRSNEEVNAYMKNKLIFTTFLYDLLIKKFICTKFNNINISTFLNMSVLQRNLYLYTNTLSEEEDKIIKIFAANLIKMTEEFFVLDDLGNIEIFRNKIFTQIVKMFKELLKYNLVNEEEREQIFRFLSESMEFKFGSKNIQSRFEDIGLLKYYIMKILLYQLVHVNDMIILKQINSPGVRTEQVYYVFQSQNEFINYSMLFTRCIGELSAARANTKQHLKFGLYTRKIFELMVINQTYNKGNNIRNFYTKSLDNSVYYFNSYKFDRNALSPKKEEASRHIEELSTRINTISDDYYEHNITYKEFYNEVNSVLKDLAQFTRGFLTCIPLIEKLPYSHVDWDVKATEGCLLGDKANVSNIRILQECIQHSTFMNSLNKLLYLLANKTKFFASKESQELNIEYQIETESLRALLQFFVISIIGNYQNLALFMNLNAENLACVFGFNLNLNVEGINHDFRCFITFLTNMLFSVGISVALLSDCKFGKSVLADEMYEYDNYIFFFNLVKSYYSAIVPHNLHARENENNDTMIRQYIDIYSTLFEITSQYLPHMSLQNPELFDLLSFTVIHIKKNLVNSRIDEITRGYWNKNIVDNLKCQPSDWIGSIENYWNNYFIMINNYLYTDLAFQDIVDIDTEFVLNFQQIKDICADEANYSPDPLLMNRIFECYLKRTINFPNLRNKVSQTQDMINLLYTTTKKKEFGDYLMDDDNFSLIHMFDSELLRNPKPAKTREDTSVYTYILKLKDKKEDQNLILHKTINYFEPFIAKCKEIKDISLSARLYHMTRYFEWNILNPIFVYINHFLLYEKTVIGKDSFAVYEIVVRFIKCAVFLYKEMEYYVKDGLDSMAIAIHLRLKNVDLIHKELEKFQEDIKKINYFKLEKIVKVFRKILKMIYFTKDEYGQHESNPNDAGISYNKFKTYSRSLTEETDIATQDLFKGISNDYRETFKASSENELGFIRALKFLSNSEFYLKVFNHAFSNLFDPLTYNNYDDPEIKENYIHRFQFKEEFNFRNYHNLGLLNNLLTHDSPKFQKCIIPKIEDTSQSTEYQEFKKIFFHFFSRLIFNNLIHNCTRVYELNEGDIDSTRISYQLLMDATGFLIKLCDNQYKPFQQYLFNFILKDHLQLNPPKIDVLDNSYIKERKGYTDKAYKAVLNPDKTRDPALSNNRFSFLNFLFSQMRILTKNLHFDNEYKILFNNRKIKNYSSFLSMYEQYFNLLLAMVRGMSKKENFKLFFEKCSESLTDSIEEHSEYFLFVKYYKSIKDLVCNPNILDMTSITVKISIFIILNNLLSQSVDDGTECDIVLLSTSLFSIDQLINVVSMYLRALYIHHIDGLPYADERFIERYQVLELNATSLEELKQLFKNGNKLEISKDNFFKLSSQIYLFIKILAEVKKNQKAQEVMKLSDLPFTSSGGELIMKMNEKLNKGEKAEQVGHSQVVPLEEKKVHHRLKLNIFRAQERIKCLKINSSINNHIGACKFFNHVVKRCDLFLPVGEEGLKIKNSLESSTNYDNYDTDENSRNDSLQRVFFVVDQQSFLISNDSIEKFSNEVDRTSPNSKLLGFLNSLEQFKNEIQYKQHFVKEHPSKTWMLDVPYDEIDKANLLISLLIVLSMFIFLREDTEINAIGEESNFDFYFFFILYPIVGAQILLNITMFIIFYFSKFKYYSMIHRIDKYEAFAYYKVLLVDCLFWNEETFLMSLNLLIAILSLFSSHLAFFFAVQLFTIVRFVPTIRQISEAFSERFGQFSAMIGFLAILTNLYSMFGFFFLQEQFKMTMGDGTIENVCASHLTCFNLYFNYGVRSSGGVGDLLPDLSIRNTQYWVRYFSDFIFYLTVILLLLNMISGIIITAFGEIRDKNEQKVEDMEVNCFICSISRDQFEKKKLDFTEHTKIEHSMKTYLHYFIGLMLMNPKQLNSSESYVVDCIKNKLIQMFPIGMVFGSKKGTFHANTNEGKDDN